MQGLFVYTVFSTYVKELLMLRNCNKQPNTFKIKTPWENH